MFKKNLAALFVLFSAIFIFSTASQAQEEGREEIEAASSSNLTGVSLPAGTQRILTATPPEGVSGFFDKVIQASGGSSEKGELEMLAWTGADFKQANVPAIISSLSSSLKAAGWQYAVAGENDGATIFTVVKSGAPARKIVGYYGVGKDALVLAWMELLPSGGTQPGSGEGSQNRTESIPQDEKPVETQPVRTSGGGSVVGSWYDGYSSILVGYTPVYGPKSFTPGRSHYFNYIFHPDGTFEFTGLMQSTMYGCTTSWFQDKRGRYTINGSRITLTLTKNFFRQHNGCAPSANKEINYKLDPETYTLVVKRNEYGKEAVCLNSGNGDACYERKQN
jgi:hypothetical protein